MEKFQNDDILMNLQIVWNNFSCEKNDEKKEFWINLFLFLYQHVNEEQTTSFLNSIPSQLCSYMQQLVYGIISNAISSSASSSFDYIENEERGEEEENADNNKTKNLLVKYILENKYKLSNDNYNLSQLIVGTPSDITAIISLRKFLTHGLGGRILDFLNNCDIKLITSRRNLSNLLLNLFPNSPWSNNYDREQYIDNVENGAFQIDTSQLKIDNFVKNFHVQKILIVNSKRTHSEFCSTMTTTTTTTVYQQNLQSYTNNDNSKNTPILICDNVNGLFSNYCDNDNDDDEENDDDDDHEKVKFHHSSLAATTEKQSTISPQIKDIQYDFNSFEFFKSKSKQSDDIAIILIDLLIKLVKEENEYTLDEYSITIQCLKFTTDNLLAVQKSNAFNNPKNSILIQLKIISLISYCLNNLLKRKENLLLFDYKIIFYKFVECLNETIGKIRIYNEDNGDDNNDGGNNKNNRAAIIKTNYWLTTLVYEILYLFYGAINNIYSIITTTNSTLIPSSTILVSLNTIITPNKFLISDILNVKEIQDLENCLINSMKVCLMNFQWQNSKDLGTEEDKESEYNIRILIEILLNFIDTIKRKMRKCNDKNRKLRKRRRQQQQKQKPKMATTTMNSSSITLVVNQEKLKQKSLIKQRQFHHNYKNNEFSCLYESILIEIFNDLKFTNLQELIIKNFRLNGICCCLYKIEKLCKFFENNEVSIQKHLYKFIRYKIIKLIYSKKNQSSALSTTAMMTSSAPVVVSTTSVLSSPSSISSVATTTVTATMQCTTCEMKFKSNQFWNELFHLYKNKFGNISKHYNNMKNDSQNTVAMVMMKLLLKHLLKISNFLTYDISSRILSEIVLPIFRNEIFQMKQQQNSTDKRCDNSIESGCSSSGNIDIILECLNIFVNYLTDIRLIKSFFIYENIKYLEELMFITELSNNCSELIKIGINNLMYLGDNLIEKANTNKQLLKIQLNSISFLTEILNEQIFNASSLFQLMTDNNNDMKSLSTTKTATAAMKTNTKDTKNPISILLESKQLKQSQLLRLASIYWNLTLNLFKNNQQFRDAFLEKFNDSTSAATTSTVVGSAYFEDIITPSSTISSTKQYQQEDQQQQKQQNSIFQLAYNSLSLFLYCHHIRIRRTAAILEKWNSNATQIPTITKNIDDNSHRYCISNASTWPEQPEQQQQYEESNYSNNNHWWWWLWWYCKEDSRQQHQLQQQQISSLSYPSSIIETKISTIVRDNLNIIQTIDIDYYYQKFNSILPSSVFLFSQNVKEYSKIFNDESESFIQVTPLNDNFFKKIQSKRNNSSVLLFDIRDQNDNNNEDFTWNFLLQESHDGVVKSLQINNSNFSSSANRSNSNQIDAENRSSSLLYKYLQNFVTFGVSYLFGAQNDDDNGHNHTSSNNNSNNNKNKSDKFKYRSFETNDDFMNILQSNDSKKFLMQIFESTLAIIMMSNDDLKAAKMQQLLRKLKTLLLLYSEKYWEYEDNACAIIHSLQSLLKVAEMMGKTLKNDKNLSSPSATVAAASGTTSVPPASSGLTPISVPPTITTLATVLESEIDYYSSKLSESENDCGDNADDGDDDDDDDDLSANETEECYLTADEGYEADAELPEISENDENIGELWNPFIPSSKYRTTVVHEGICKIVIEILIELSTKCVINPSLWSSSLSQLANRLYVIRESLGGPLFLLKGFTPILKCNDPRLKDFQQSILDLITDLNTPEILSTYFSLLAFENPPIEILIRYMAYICALGLRVQPKAEVEFPFETDGTLNSTCNPLSFNQIKQYRNYYEYYNMKTALTQSALIVPLDNMRFWQNDEGFTISFWMQMKSYFDLSSKATASSSSQSNGTDEKDKINQTHLMSFGSNQLLLSVYINSNMNLVFETSRPSNDVQQMSRDQKYNKVIGTTTTAASMMNTTSTTPATAAATNDKSKKATEEFSGLSIFKRKRKFQKDTGLHQNDEQNQSSSINILSSSANKENISLNRAYPITTTTAAANITGSTATVGGSGGGDKISSSPLSSALQSTKLAIINSFSQFQLFSSQFNSENGLNSSFDGHQSTSSIELKNLRLSHKKWTHLCFAINLINHNSNTKTILVTIIIDGTDQYTISLSFSCNNANFQQMIKNEQFQIFCLGQNDIKKSSSSSSLVSSPSLSFPSQMNRNIETAKSIEKCKYLEYSISTVMIFQKCFNRKSILASLTALGPDCANLTYCHVGNIVPNYGFLNFTKTNCPYFENFNDCITVLSESLIASYSMYQPNFMIGFEKNEAGIREGYRLGSIFFESGLVTKKIPSIQTAVYLNGGLSCMLYLFARTVELTTDSNTQACALDLLLGIARSDANLYTEFVKKDYLNLIGYVIRTDRCTKDVFLLKNLINNSCTKQVIAKRYGNDSNNHNASGNGGSGVHIIENTSACVIYPNLIISVIKRYSDWHKFCLKESKVLDTLLASIQILVREKHPHQEYNIQQLQKCGIIKELLNLCKMNIVESPSPIYISTMAADLFVNILNVFAGSSPQPSLLDEIMKLLLVLHKPSECFVTHDRSKFYFLISPDPPLKQKLLNLPLPSRQFTQIIRDRKRMITSAGKTRRLMIMHHKGNSRDRSSNYNNDDRRDNEQQENFTDYNCYEVDDYYTKYDQKYNSEGNDVRKYRIPIFENLQNLQSVVNCTRLSTKKATSVFNSIETERFNSSLFNMKKQRAYLIQDQRNRSRKISRKRVKILSRLNSEYETSRKRKKDKSMSESSEKDLDLFTSKEYDVVQSDEVSSLNDSKENNRKKSKKSSLSKTEYSGYPGIIRLQEKLFILLKDFLLILPDSMVDEVLIHYIKIEILLVLANHKSTNVRSAIIKLFSVLCDRLPIGEIQSYTKKFYWHHLANQISLNPTDRNLIESIVSWCTGKLYSFDEFLIRYGYVNGERNYDDDHDQQIKIMNKYGLNALIAILPQTLNDCELAVNCFQFIESVYVKVSDCNSYLIENGLIQSIIKSLYKLYSKSKPIVNGKIEAAIVSLLTTIAQSSIKSIGHISILWELLNLLSFYQENNVLNVVEAFRAVQAYILYNLLQSFLPSTTMSISLSRFKSSDLHLQNSQISSSEIKTRFDLLVDRSSQFFITANPTHKPTTEEIKLFELMVPLGTSGNTRCNNFIAWGLLPSRPYELRASIINSLWKICRGESIPSIVCDGKIIKTLLWLCLTTQNSTSSSSPTTTTMKVGGSETPTTAENGTDYNDNRKSNNNGNNGANEYYMDTLCALCRRLGISLHETWNVDSVLDKLETNRDNCLKEQKPNIDKTVYKYESVAQSCIDSSMIITRIVTELQNAERKILISQMKEYDESIIFREWVAIIQNMTNEGAPWFCEKIYPKSWELDDTEGPSRVRTRLKRCNLDIDQKFILLENRDPPYPKPRPLDYLIATYDQHMNFSLNSKILYNFTAKYLPLDGEIDGDLIITETKLYFIATYKYKFFYIYCNIQNITEIWLRRYQHQEKAIEIFLDSNKSLLFALQNYEDFKTIKEIFTDKIIQCPDQSKLLLITQQWREGQLTNWEYLMSLNQFAGRTYNDLMQYPVFPWILSNFHSNTLDLLDIRNYRKLDKPIAIQHEGSENHYISNYTYISNTITNLGTLQLKPYHYSSHYSNSGTVLHFLVRVPPFTTYFLRYQDNNFDIPDRTFHAVNTTWKLASKDSPTDVKELIPEFFCLPEMFENFESFNFGYRQSGEIVNHVDLPPWCNNNPRLFVLIHRQALESEVVRMNLHNWIDLIFGYKQTGQAAVDAVNVFHPATYAEFSMTEISDPIERKAVETMVKTYGQMPKQLLKIPHPPSSDLNYTLNEPFVMSSVRGLRWGTLTGSPQLSKPRCLHKYRLAEMAFTNLISFKNTNVIYGLPEKCCIMQGPEADTYNLISWNYDDNVVRIQPLSEPTTQSKPLLMNDLIDEITAYGSSPNSNSLWFGHKSGRITVYQCCSNYDNEKNYIRNRQSSAGIKLSYNSAFRTISFRNSFKLSENEYENRRSSRGSSSTTEFNQTMQWQGPIYLIRHTDEITSICVSTEFHIVVSVGRDGLAVIWDSNSYSYIRTIERPFEIQHSPISVVAISPTLGDILTVHTIEKFANPTTNYNNSSNSNNVCNNNGIGSGGANKIDDECFEVTEENLEDFVNISMNVNGKSLMRLHSVNAKYISHYTLEDKRILSASYSYIKEGTGINVIATGLEDGIIRFWSSWDLSFIQEITISNSDIISVTYSTYQHLVALSRDNFIHVWESEGIQENSPKFPQIFFNKANSLL